MVEAMLSGMEASGSKRGEFFLPSRHLLYAAQVVTQDFYPRLINLIRDLAGGALIMGLMVLPAAASAAARLMSARS